MSLTRRQSWIAQYISEHPMASTRQIVAAAASQFGSVSRQTIIRDLNVLVQNETITRQGEGRSVIYISATQSPLLFPVNVEEYFSRDATARTPGLVYFNPKVMGQFGKLFSKAELAHLDRLTEAYQSHIKQLSPGLVKREMERLTIDLAWKSSAMEGSTYSIIETETLIKNHQAAAGHSKAEAAMILNHKDALDDLRTNATTWAKPTLQKIEDLHIIITKGLNIYTGIRKVPVRVGGTSYIPMDTDTDIAPNIAELVTQLCSNVDMYSRALMSLLMISYMQPFEDGNKRTARMLCNAMVLQGGGCPLSFRNVGDKDYKHRLMLFYEINCATAMKELFMEQYEFAVNEYFQV